MTTGSDRIQEWSIGSFMRDNYWHRNPPLPHPLNFYLQWLLWEWSVLGKGSGGAPRPTRAISSGIERETEKRNLSETVYSVVNVSSREDEHKLSHMNLKVGTTNTFKSPNVTKGTWNASVFKIYFVINNAQNIHVWKINHQFCTAGIPLAEHKI